MAGFSTEGVMPMMPTGMAGGDGFGFGAGGGWIVFLIIAMMFGWGRNGFGAGGAGGFAGGELMADQFALQDLKNGHRAIESGINGLANGICDSTYAMAQQNGQTRELIGLGFANINSNLDSCCCTTNRNIDSVRYENSKNTCDIITNANMNTRDLIQAGNANTQRIVDMMTANTIQELRDRNQDLTLSATLQAQSNNIINAIRPTPVPAYQSCNPWGTPVFGNGCGGFNGCGNI